MFKTEVKEVSIYRNGCFVKRRGLLQLEAGKQSVTIEGLSATLEESTVRMALPAGISGNNVQVNRLTGKQKEELTAELKKQIKLTENRINVRNKQIEMWNSNADFSEKTAVNIADVASYIEQMPERLEKLYQQIEQLTEEKKKLNEQLNKLDKQNQCYLVSADITAQQAGNYPVEISYFENNAGWGPIYEVHTSDEKESLTIRLKASMWQSTIEDWSKVKVTLFTANPQISGDIPTLYPQRLSFYEPARMMKANMLGSTMMMAARKATYDSVEPVEEEAMDCEEAMYEAAPLAAGSSQQNDTMMEYQLDGLWDVTKDNPVKADLTDTVVDCRYHVICVAKQEDVGYLAAEVNTADLQDILQTEAIIYHKGAYLSRVSIDPDMSKEKYDISLGRDETVRLKRTQKKKYTSNVLLKGQKKTEFEYEIKVTSAKNRPCQITLIDQIPVSTDKSIVVDSVKLSEGKLDEKTGEVKWELQLEPSESRTFELDYTVAWPKDKNINL